MSLEIYNFVDSNKISIIKIDDIISSAQQSNNMLMFFYGAMGVIALILSFFLIWISFYSNIRDNICEFGIMRYNIILFRAIGLTKAQSQRVFLYEALVIILSSIIVGTFIGIVVSISLILQFNLFSELPFELLVFMLLNSSLIHFIFYYVFLVYFYHFWDHIIPLLK